MILQIGGLGEVVSKVKFAFFNFANHLLVVIIIIVEEIILRFYFLRIDEGLVKLAKYKPSKKLPNIRY